MCFCWVVYPGSCTYRTKWTDRQGLRSDTVLWIHLGSLVLFSDTQTDNSIMMFSRVKTPGKNLKKSSTPTIIAKNRLPYFYIIIKTCYNLPQSVFLTPLIKLGFPGLFLTLKMMFSRATYPTWWVTQMFIFEYPDKFFTSCVPHPSGGCESSLSCLIISAFISLNIVKKIAYWGSDPVYYGSAS